MGVLYYQRSLSLRHRYYMQITYTWINEDLIIYRVCLLLKFEWELCNIHSFEIASNHLLAYLQTYIAWL